MRKKIRISTLSSSIFIIIIVMFGVAAPWIAPYGVNQLVGNIWGAPSSSFLFGTDEVGRDMFSRLIYGTRTTLLIATSATLISFFLGGSAGFIAGSMKGPVGSIIDGVNNVLSALPTLIFSLVVLAVLPSTTSVLILLLGVIDATRVFRVARPLAAEISATEYVESAYLRGENYLSIVFYEILPNALPPLIAEFGMRLVFSVLFLSSLSFLGLGVQLPSTDWGSLLRENKDGILFGVWAAFVPGCLIALFGLSVNHIADCLVDKLSDFEEL